jgi:hypothetical protein
LLNIIFVFIKDDYAGDEKEGMGGSTYGTIDFFEPVS